MAGQVTSLETLQAAELVVALVKKHGLDTEQISGIAERRERWAVAQEVGKKLQPTLVDKLIDMLAAPAATPTPTSTPAQQWKHLDTAIATPTPTRQWKRLQPAEATP